jgi:hypothetical protein
MDGRSEWYSVESGFSKDMDFLILFQRFSNEVLSSPFYVIKLFFIMYGYYMAFIAAAVLILFLTIRYKHRFVIYARQLRYYIPYLVYRLKAGNPEDSLLKYFSDSRLKKMNTADYEAAASLVSKISPELPAIMLKI